MHYDAGGGQLEGEGDTIQSAADLGHDRCIGIREFERMAAMGDLLDEQLHRRKAQRLCLAVNDSASGGGHSQGTANDALARPRPAVPRGS